MALSSEVTSANARSLGEMLSGHLGTKLGGSELFTVSPEKPP